MKIIEKLMDIYDDIDEMVGWGYARLNTRARVILWALMIVRITFPAVMLWFGWINTTAAFIIELHPTISMGIVISAITKEDS